MSDNDNGSNNKKTRKEHITKNEKFKKQQDNVFEKLKKIY